jgi:predicted TIM-barrel fold metal-dependent hydrolase
MEGAFDLDARLADMDSEGIDVQVLYGGLAIGTTSFEDHGFARDFATAYNDWLLGDVCGHSDRLKGVAVVALQDVAGASEEVGRAARRGAVAVTIPPAVRLSPGEPPRPLDDPALTPFFEAVVDADLAVGVHNAPGMNNPLPAADLFDNYVQVHQVSFPVDQMVAFTALTMGGVLDRFPTLRAAFLECGVGWVPYWIDRAHEHREKRGDLIPDMKADPREYIERGQCYFSFECEDPFVGHFVEHFGADPLIWASDYPHWDCEFPGSVMTTREVNAALPDEVLDKALDANPRRLYRL